MKKEVSNDDYLDSAFFYFNESITNKSLLRSIYPQHRSVL